MVMDPRLTPWAPAHPFEIGMDLPGDVLQRMMFPQSPAAAALASLAKGITGIQDRGAKLAGRAPKEAKPPQPTYGTDADGNVTMDGGATPAGGVEDPADPAEAPAPPPGGERQEIDEPHLAALRSGYPGGLEAFYREYPGAGKAPASAAPVQNPYADRLQAAKDAGFSGGDKEYDDAVEAGDAANWGNPPKAPPPTGVAPLSFSRQPATLPPGTGSPASDLAAAAAAKQDAELNVPAPQRFGAARGMTNAGAVARGDKIGASRAKYESDLAKGQADAAGTAYQFVKDRFSMLRDAATDEQKQANRDAIRQFAQENQITLTGNTDSDEKIVDLVMQTRIKNASEHAERLGARASIEARVRARHLDPLTGLTPVGELRPGLENDEAAVESIERDRRQRAIVQANAEYNYNQDLAETEGLSPAQAHSYLDGKYKAADESKAVLELQRTVGNELGLDLVGLPLQAALALVAKAQTEASGRRAVEAGQRQQASLNLRTREFENALVNRDQKAASSAVSALQRQADSLQKAIATAKSKQEDERPFEELWKQVNRRLIDAKNQMTTNFGPGAAKAAADSAVPTMEDGLDADLAFDDEEE